jgi:hypothetical protein
VTVVDVQGHITRSELFKLYPMPPALADDAKRLFGL